jgi:hypothetical protein
VVHLQIAFSNGVPSLINQEVIRQVAGSKMERGKRRFEAYTVWQGNPVYNCP